MGKYVKYQRKTYERRNETHPVWRGIGCLLMVIVPLMSYAGAVTLVNYGVGHGWPFPPEFIGYIQFPDWVWNAPVLPMLAAPIANYPNLWAVLIVFLILLLLLSGVFSTVYSILYRITGPSKYSPLDAPPSKHKAKVYKR
jgi:hypothetical protein